MSTRAVKDRPCSRNKKLSVMEIKVKMISKPNLSRDLDRKALYNPKILDTHKSIPKIIPYLSPVSMKLLCAFRGPSKGVYRNFALG